MKTKDEILDWALMQDGGVGHVSKAMDEYAKQQAIEYTKWMDVNAVRNGEDVWLCRTSGFKTSMTSEQLYNQFIESQNK